MKCDPKLTLEYCARINKLAEFKNLKLGIMSDFNYFKMLLFIPELPKDETLESKFKGELNYNLNSFGYN